jgi:hypothetical protein
MPRRSQTADPAQLQQSLLELLQVMPQRLRDGSVGEQVCELVRVHHLLRDLGATIGATLSPDDSDSGRGRLIAYLRSQVGRIVHTDELMIVAGIGDYPRRIRELRALHGWPIMSGLAVRDIRSDALARSNALDAVPSVMAREEYLLVEDRQDGDAPRRWELAGQLRDEAGDIADKIARYLKRSLGQRVTAEELRYVAGNSAKWTAAVRDLHSRGHPISARPFGDADMPVGIYILRRGG